MGETDRPMRRTLRPGSSIAVGVVGAVAGSPCSCLRCSPPPRLGARLVRDPSPSCSCGSSWCARQPSSTTRASGSSTRCGSWTSRGRPSPRCAPGGPSSSWPTGGSTPPGEVPADPGRPKYGRSLLTVPANRMAKAGSLAPSAATGAADAPAKRPKVEAQGGRPRSRPASRPTASARGVARGSPTRPGTRCRSAWARRARLLRHRRLRPLGRATARAHHEASTE